VHPRGLKGLPVCGVLTASSNDSPQQEAPCSCSSSSSSEAPRPSTLHTTTRATINEAAATEAAAAAAAAAAAVVDEAPRVGASTGRSAAVEPTAGQEQQQQGLRGAARKRCATQSRLWVSSSPHMQPGAGAGAGADADGRADADVVACVSQKRHKAGAM
jgi:hypothetical protein